MNYQEELIDYIAELGKIPRKDIDVQLPVYNSGIISSLKLLELMSFIENHFGIIIKPEELIEDNFRDVRAIVSFIHKKLNLSNIHN